MKPANFKALKPHLIIGVAFILGFFFSMIITWNMRSQNATNWENIRCEIQENK